MKKLILKLLFIPLLIFFNSDIFAEILYNKNGIKIFNDLKISDGEDEYEARYKDRNTFITYNNKTYKLSSEFIHEIDDVIKTYEGNLYFITSEIQVGSGVCSYQKELFYLNNKNNNIKILDLSQKFPEDTYCYSKLIFDKRIYEANTKSLVFEEYFILALSDEYHTNDFQVIINNKKFSFIAYLGSEEDKKASEEKFKD